MAYAGHSASPSGASPERTSHGRAPQRRRAVHRALEEYRDRMARYAGMRSIDVYYDSVAVSTILDFVDKRARPMIAFWISVVPS